MTTKKIAFMFPGQGSQVVGMGSELAKAYSVARHVFEEVNDALSEDLFKIMQEGPDDFLKMTRNAQPALFATSLAGVRVIEHELGEKLSELGAAAAGHSLGEYSAMAASDCLSIGSGARLLRQRGDAMQTAVPIGEGAMAAILGADEGQIVQIIDEAKETGLVQIANDNAPGQIVISGESASISASIEIAKKMGIRRAINLPVSAPFHCDLMEPAAEAMKLALQNAKIGNSLIPIYCNVTAEQETKSEALRNNLFLQITSRVRWRETLMAMNEFGVNTFIEVGTGRVLSGLVKRCIENASFSNLDKSADLGNVLSLIKGSPT